ncbi:amidase [soil metagenome]
MPALPPTAGVPERLGLLAEADAPAVAALRRAGAVIVGLTATPVLCGDIQTHNPVSGRTANPWDPSRSAGGSSGGSAAAVAAGMVSLALASEPSGSIRTPATWCGVAGLKPSHGIVSKRGHVPEGVGAYPTADVSVAGPIGCCVDDLVLALEVLAGPEPELAGAWTLALPPPRATDPRNLRVLVWWDDPTCPVSDDVVGAVDQVTRALSEAGATVVVEPVPGGLQRFVDVFGAVTQGEITGNTPLDPEAPIEPPGTLTHQRWAADETARQALEAELAERFRHHDVILCPALPVVAIPHDTERPPAERTFDVDGRAEPYRHLDRWCSIATVAKAPAVVVPVSRSATGLPVAVQLIGPHLEDRTALAAAALVERLVGFSPLA